MGYRYIDKKDKAIDQMIPESQCPYKHNRKDGCTHTACELIGHCIGYGDWFTYGYLESESIVHEFDDEEDKQNHKHTDDEDIEYFFNAFKYCPECGIPLMP